MSNKRKSSEGRSPESKKEKQTVRVVCVTGTPGVGKTTICALVKDRLEDDKFQFLNIGELIKERKLFSEWDDEMNCSIFDDKKVKNELKSIIAEAPEKGIKSIVIDFHSVGFIPRKLVDKVFAIRTDTNKLWSRLEDRGYKEVKIKENVEAEIFMESLNEAVDQFGEDVVEECENNTEEDRDEIVKRICSSLNQNKN
jgi:adenylate kinase